MQHKTAITRSLLFYFLLFADFVHANVGSLRFEQLSLVSPAIADNLRRVGAINAMLTDTRVAI